MLIAFAGRKGAGKSAAADLLENNHKFVRIGFADPIRRFFQNEVKVNPQHFTMHGKEESCRELSGKSLRYAMQTMGTEWGREMIDPAFWCNVYRQSAMQVLLRGGSIVTEDVRFKNELATIWDLHGVVFWIERGSGLEDIHKSENSISASDCNGVIDNRGPHIQDYLQEVRKRIFPGYFS